MQIEQQLQALNQDNIDSGNWRFASIACTLDYGLLLKLLLQFHRNDILGSRYCVLHRV